MDGKLGFMGPYYKFDIYILFAENAVNQNSSFKVQGG